MMHTQITDQHYGDTIWQGKLPIMPGGQVIRIKDTQYKVVKSIVLVDAYEGSPLAYDRGDHLQQLVVVGV